MKKYKLYLLLAALVGLTASCSRDAEESGLQTTDNSTVSIGASIDPGVRTRAGETYTIPDGHKLRYVLEVWSTGENAAVIHREEQEATDLAGINFTFQLEKTGNYQALLWADFIKADAGSSNQTNPVTYKHYPGTYYTTTSTDGLKKIELKQLVFNNEAVDAFFACVDIEKTAEAYNSPVTLKRPFGQVNIIEKDGTLAAKVKEVKVTCSIPRTFDVSTGTPGEAQEFNPNLTLRAEPSGARKANLAYLYVFAPATGQLTLGETKLEFTSTAAGITFPSFTIPANMPVERNRRTNISGSILKENSSATTLSVSVSTDWETPDEEKDVDLVWDGQYPTSVDEAKKWLGPETSGADDPAAINHVFTITAARQLAAMHYLWKNNKIKLPGAIGENDEGGGGTRGDNYAYASYNLAVDIDLNNKPWTPIGTLSSGGSESLEGTFNGQGHTVSGMNVSGAIARGGLFSGVGVTGTVQFLNVKGYINTTSTRDCGGIVAYFQGKIAFCSFQGSISATLADQYNPCYAGGIAGHTIGSSFYPSSGTIISCYSVLTGISATNTDDGSKAASGGISGQLRTGTIKGCYWQEVTGLDNTNPYGSTFGEYSVADNGHFTNAAGANAAVSIMNNYDSEYEYHWQADPAGGYPVLVKKTQP